ncbi:Dynein axonemal heavy chain 6 [Phytophthora ramorum]|uniref:Dynein axonemal heavy chain 6 n=1 Tax=Phytophthora ramorum TaxID=164328 RepID=UPI00309844A9|nr:Dynein axonemal heavy chain 6 [Phytophthora ramorum]
MQDHVLFGAPPKLRPRTAGVSRSSLPPNGIDYGTSSTSIPSAPERLASTVNALTGSPSLLLRQRLQSPRPGSAAPLQTPRAAASRDDKGVFMKPPMRPKSATAASRVSRHRMQLVQEAAVAVGSNQSEELEQRSESEVEKEDALRPGMASMAGRQFGVFGKRPFSASPAPSSRPLTPSNQMMEASSRFTSGKSASGAKRPHSAAASTRYQPFRAREKSTSSLTSLSVVSHTAKAPRSMSTSSSRGYSRGDRLLASTRESSDNTFVYAVPRHHFESGLPYDPYDIIPVTHEALFGGGSFNQLQDAHSDYYTISRSGYTFHLKSDNFQSTFLSLGDWEAQKAQFTQLRSLSTFSAFRYRKVFQGWRQLVRSNKREAARETLISDCYFSYPVLLKGMLEVRTELANISKQQLMWNFDGETISLENFAAAHTKFVKARTKEFRQVTARIQKVLSEVCQVYLDDMAPLHAGFPGHEFALSVRKSSNFHILGSYVQCEQGLASAHQQLMQHKHFRSARVTTSDAAEARAALLMSSIAEHGTRAEKVNAFSVNQADELEDIRWTMASIKRRKCRQLTKFVMLIDFLLLDTFARVVKQSLELLSSFLLRGANAGTVRSLTDRDDLTRAMHHTVSTARKHSLQPAGEGNLDVSSQARQSQRTPLTKQQIKSFLHAAWEGKFRTLPSTTGDPAEQENSAAVAGLSVMAMENRLEALLLFVLSKHAGATAEAFTVDDLFSVAESTLPQLLVLPHFTTANMSIYTVSGTENLVSTATANMKGENEGLLPSLEQEVLAISCLSRRPLFTLDVGTSIKAEKRGRRSYQVCFKPELDALVRTLQSIIIGFMEAFRDVPPLLSSPELRSVLNFADDIRALNLHPSFRGKGLRAATNTTRRRVSIASEMDGTEDNTEGGEDCEEHFRCPADRLVERMEEDRNYLSVRDEIQDLTRSALNGAQDLASCYAKVLELRQQNESVNFDVKARQFRRNEYTLDQMKEDATNFTDQLAALETLKLCADVEFLHFDMRQLQADLVPSPARCLDVMRELLPKLARERCDQFLHYISLSSAKIEKPVVQDLDAFTTYLLNLRDVYDEILDKGLDLTFLREFFHVLDTLKFNAPVETAKVFELCDPEFQALKSHVQEAYTSRDTDLQHYGPLLAESLNKLERRTSWLQSTTSGQEVAAQSSTCQDARDSAAKLYHEATEMQQEASRLTRIQRVFEEASNDLRPPSTTFEGLNALAVELKLKSELWEAVCEADEHLEACSTDTIRSVDLDTMGVVASRVDRVVENIRQCSAQVVGAFELDRLEKLQATLHGLAPVIRDLRNPHLAERHWSKLEHKMQCSLVSIVVETAANSEVPATLDSTDSTETLVSNRLDLQVQQLLDANAVAYGTTIRHVSEEASAEAAMAGSFLSVVRTWEAQEIPVESKKDRDGRDVFCIGDCIELTSLIEESQVLLRVMDLSTYSLVVQERLPKMLHDLEHTKESLELLQMCQRKWDYTQRLVSIDFARTFPEQAKQLQKYDGAWRSLTLGLYNRSLCLPFGVSPEHRQALKGILEGFEAAAKTLADHLLIKRQVFPAFFKLSDLELATLLSKCRDVGYIPSFLFQCFDNVGQIVFGTRDAFQDILQVTSRVYGDSEAIPMGKNLKARGPVEQWLAAVEKRLAEQLRRSTKQAIDILSRHDNSGSSLKLDTSHFPIQTILLADRVVRCLIIENGLQSITPNKFDRIVSQLAVYSTDVKSQIQPQDATGSPTEVPVLTPREIALRTCLCLQEIQFRDAFASHVASQQTGSASSLAAGGLAIDWEFQLKYRMDDATTVGHECHVQINTLSIPYGFNYLTPNEDTVVTPGSLRSLFSLYACVRHAQGCFLTGPSESGKRTLSMQVSSMLGRRSFSAAVTSYAHATRLLIGALHAGGTFCANLQLAASVAASARLIKTLATTLASIEHAVLTKNPIVGLHRSPITFVPGTAMLVILPSTKPLTMADAEDIKIWTAPLCRFAVVQWDWTYIVEALLSSKGFAAPRELAKQLLALWQLVRSSVELAQGKLPASHETPFSLSSFKSIVLNAAAQLEAHASTQSVQDFQQMLIQNSVRQYFQARVSAEQLKVLETALENVFSRAHIASDVFDQWKSFQALEQQKRTATSPELQESIALALRELHFVPRKKLLDAVASLADALTFGASAVLVGAPGVGKTAAYQVLAKALELCLQRGEQGGASTTQEVKQGPVRASPAVLSKRSNSFLTSKAEKKLQASVAVSIVLPMALTVSQLYGGVSLDGQGRIPSILGQLIREAQEIYTPTARCGTNDNPSEAQPMKSLLDFPNQIWVVFDDALDLRWLEALLAVLSNSSPLLAFEDGEYMTLPPNLRIVFEVSNLRDATPTFLHSNAILPLSTDDPQQMLATSKSRRMRNVDPFSRMNVATAYLHRYLELQREVAALHKSEAANSSTWSPVDTFNVVERWLLKTSLLSELTAVFDGSDGAVYLSQLQRVTNLTSMLQSLLSTASSLPEPTRITSSDKAGADPTKFAQDIPHGQIRVEMALVYSLLWGFAASTGGQRAIQRQLSDMVRREFDHLTPAWVTCGSDVNLMETLLDLQELRFVPVVSASGQPTIPPQVATSSGHSSISTLFVPTVSSLVVHAAIKEALRSGRGVLLLGGDSTRRTTLARYFLGQLDILRAVESAGGVSNMLRAQNGDDDGDKARKPDVKSNEAATLASVKRIRLRQITLVTRMALRLQKDSNRAEVSLQPSRDASVASIATASDNESMASVVEAEEGAPLAITPSTDTSKTAMVRQFDRGDVIPFFFAMPQTGAGDVATELANCLERMLQRERTGVFEPPPGKTALLILDDLHLAVPQEDAANPSSQLPLSPSVYAYLRYVHERGVVYRGTSCLPTSVENLMLFTTMRSEHFPTTSREAACSVREEPQRKLTSKFFPVLTPSCGLEELQHVFGQALATHWGVSNSKSATAVTLATAVRLVLPVVFAASTVLWDRLRATYKFCLHDLARVYEGLAGVGTSLLPDVETFLRLWTHECNRTLREPSLGLCSLRQDHEVATEIANMRSLMSQVAQRRASARASRLSLNPEAGVSFIVASKRQSMQAGQPAKDENASPASLLALFIARSSAPTGKSSRNYSRLSQQYSSFQEQQHHASMAGGLWAHVPASIYYSGGSISTNTQGEGDGIAGSDALGLFKRVARRSSASFMRQMSLQASVADGDAHHRTLGRNGRWIYAEISFEDDSEAVSTAAVQEYFRDLQTFSSTAMTSRRSKTAVALPRDVSPVPFTLARVTAQVDRVFARPAARLILLENSNGAADTLLRFTNLSRLPQFQGAMQTTGAILTMSGLQDDSNVVARVHTCLAVRWKRLLLELYERVGVAGQEATLVVKRLDLLPPAIMNQLQALMTTGEVPGLFSLEEQVHLATRVCDERLLELKTKHAAQAAQIRSEAESTRDQALAILHQKQRDAPATPLLEAFQLVETRYQRELRSKLARVDLRWQQDSDDLRREREVESESVAATVMALTRPLGVTSGKWASAVARMCSKLRVVLLIDKKHERRVRSSSSNVFATCDVVSVPQLGRDSLRTLVFGHFHAQVQQLLGGNSPAETGLVDFLHQTLRSLWTLACMATDMHLAVVDAFSAEATADEQSRPPLVRAFAMASIFAKLVVDGYKREEEARAKASWFLDLSNRLDRDLGALRSSDAVLSEQLTTIAQQLTTHAAKLVEQKEDAERIRTIMQRFQVAADEQILVTNEAQEVAQRELQEPMACLEEANRALLLVDRRHIVEIKSFVSPPPLVHLVLGAVCVLFQLEPSWESARRLLLGDANVVQTLLQFNKDAVSAATLAKLEAEFLRDERFCREEVERQSVAAASMVGWVRAIYQYASARHQVQPTLDKLEKAQSRLNLIMQEFQVSKQRVVEADEAWQVTQAAIDAATTRKEALTGEIASLGARCDSGGLAMQALQEDRQRQQGAASASSMRRGFSLTSWNALLSAGALAYACELSLSPRRDQVFQAWESAYCSYGGLAPGCPPTSTCCTFVPSIAVVLKDSALSGEQTRDVQVNRERETPLTALFTGDYPEDGNPEAENTMKLVTAMAGVCFSRRSLWDAFLLSLLAATPTLPVVMITRYSPELEELLVTCARRVWHWNQLRMVHARSPDFDDEFRLAARLGHQLLVLDVEPLDSEPQSDSEHGICLHSALAWTTARVNGAENLLVPRRTREVDGDDTPNAGSATDFIPLHSNFRLILTSHASRTSFGEALDMIPTLDAQLHSSDVGDVMLDKMWSSSALKTSESADSVANTGGAKLKRALREHGQLAQQFEASHAQLTKLLEAAAVTSQFPLTQTQALRDRIAAIQEARHVLRDKRREIQEQLDLVKCQCSPFARTGTAVFNAFNLTVCSFGANASPLLTLQVFLPMLLDAVVPSSTPLTPAPSGSPTPTAPLLKDSKRHSSIHRTSLFARTATSLVLSASTRGQLSSVGVQPDVLTKLLIHIAPLVPPASPHGEWYRFLLQVIVGLEEIQPTTQKVLHRPVQEDEDPQAQAIDARASASRSVKTILLQTKLRTGGTRDASLSSITAEACMALAVANSRPDFQRRVVSLIFNGCKAPIDAGSIDDMVRLALPEISSRSDRLRVGLVLFPELVQHVCDRVLAGYGVPLNFHHRCSGVANVGNVLGDSEGTGLQEGFWLRTMRSLPEETAVLVLTKHDFHSFAFARRVFFHGIEGSTAIQIRVLQLLGERQFQVTNEDEAPVSVLARIDSEVSVPLAQLYVLPRCVHPPEENHQEEARQLLLMADDFKHVAQMENTQLEALEAVPLAVVSMKGDVPEYWEALFQILNRSCQRTSSAAFQRHGSVNLISGVLGNNLVRRSSVVPSETSANDSAFNPPVTLSTVATTSSRVTTQRTSGAHRSSQSMVRRLSAIELVAPAYPRLVAAVEDLRALPVHLRGNVVCLRDEHEEEEGASSGDQTPPSICKCLQSTILRLTLHPCVQTLSALANPGEDDAKTPPADLWLIVSGLVLFHATLLFRSQVLRSTYVGSLPPVGTGAAFHYSDDVFLTAIHQCLVAFTEKQRHHHSTQQRRQPDRGSTLSEVFQRRIYQQVVLSSYARLAVGQQEIAFLKRLFSECLQLANWEDPSLGELGVSSRSSSIRGPSRQMSAHDQLRGVSVTEDTPSSTRSSITPLMRGPGSLTGAIPLTRAPSSLAGTRAPSSVSATTCLLEFLAFPGEVLRQEDLTMSQWLELMWGYSASLDQQTSSKLHALLLGHQQAASNRRGSLEDTSRDLLVSSGGVELTACLQPQWMRAFGWAGENHAVSLGTAADLAGTIPVRVAIDALQAILHEALPSRFDCQSWNNMERTAEAENNDGVGGVPLENLEADPALTTMVAVYNLQVEACSLALEAMLANLMELETRVHTVHAVATTFCEQLEEEEEVDQDHEEDDDEEDEGNALHLVDIEDIHVRQQVVAILRNEVPLGFLGRSSSAATPTTSLHDLFQHFQDWYESLTQSHSSTEPRHYWLPGMLASNLPVSHLLEAAKTQFCSKISTEASSSIFTLRLNNNNNNNNNGATQKDSNFLPENTFAIIDGVVLLGASWSEESQSLHWSGDLHQRVQLICSLSCTTTQPLQRVPLLASHDGSSLLECPLSVDCKTLNPLSTPFLVPIGSHLR